MSDYIVVEYNQAPGQPDIAAGVLDKVTAAVIANVQTVVKAAGGRVVKTYGVRSGYVGDRGGLVLILERSHDREDCP